MHAEGVVVLSTVRKGVFLPSKHLLSDFYDPPLPTGPGRFKKDAAFLLTVGGFLLTVGGFLLTVELSYTQLSQLTILAFLLRVAYSFSFSAYSWSFVDYRGKVLLIRTCKQRSSTVSKKAPAVSRKASPF